MDSDELIIRHVLKGNPDSFRDIVVKYQGCVYAICLNMTGDAHEAENMAQETFLQAYRSLRRYEFKGFKTWLSRIAVNKCIDWKRSKKNERQHNIIYLDDAAEIAETDGESPSEQIIKNEDSARVKVLLDRLPEKYGRVLKKYYMNSKSCRQISQEEGISIKTVESRLYRAKKIMKEKWKEEERDETL